MSKQLDAKTLITGGFPIHESPEDQGAPDQHPPRRAGDPAHRANRQRPRSVPPGFPSGEDMEDMGGMDMENPGMLTRRERDSFKSLVILDMLHALRGDSFYKELAQLAIYGGDPSPGLIQHFLDEAGNFADQMTPDVRNLMEKFARMPRR